MLIVVIIWLWSHDNLTSSCTSPITLHWQHKCIQQLTIYSALWSSLRCDYILSSSVVSRAFSVLCVFSKFGHHPHPLGYLCAKFHFFCDFHCCASPWRKITYSITHSSSIFDVQGTKALALQSITYMVSSTGFKSGKFEGHSCVAIGQYREHFISKVKHWLGLIRWGRQ